MTKKLQQPSAPDSDASGLTRQRILAAAKKLFSEQGFAATSISHIAKTAAINPSLIYHHFTNKQALWYAVKIAMIKNYFKVDDLDNLNDYRNFTAFLKNIVDKRFAFFCDNPEACRMYQWQMLEKEASCFSGLEKEHAYIINKWREAIIHFQKQKEIRTDLHCDLILALINGISGSYFTQSVLLPYILESHHREAFRKQYQQQVVQMLLSHLGVFE